MKKFLVLICLFISTNLYAQSGGAGTKVTSESQHPLRHNASRILPGDLNIVPYTLTASGIIASGISVNGTGDNELPDLIVSTSFNAPHSFTLPSTGDTGDVYIKEGMASGQLVHVYASGTWVTQGSTTSDTAYGVTWNNSTTAPTQNAVYDKIETIAGGSESTSVADTATLDMTLTGTEVKGDVITLKDLVTTAPLTGSTNDILVGADADITIAIPQATTSADGYVVQADWDSWTDHVADNTQAHSDYTLNTGDTITGAITINDNGGTGSTLLTIGDANDADSVVIYGDLTVTGDDLFMGTNTSGMVLIADGTNFNPVAISGDASITATGEVVVPNDSHDHTTTTISGLDISSDTNLAVSTPITLTGDSVGMVNQGTTTTVLHGNAAGNPAFSAVTYLDVTAMTSANLQTIVSDETATGLLVFNQNPTINHAVLTGIIDGGGASSTEIVNGANPTTDAAGEIAVDSSAAPGSGVRFYGDSAYTLSGTYSKGFVILAPVAADDYPVWCSPYAITIKHVRVQCLGGTNIVGQLTECDGEGINCAVVDSADITATANNSVDDDGTLSNPSIDAGDYVGWATTSISGTPTSATITFDYVVNQTN